MIQTAIDTPSTATLDGAAAGLTITAELRNGTGTLADVVTVSPRLDSQGDPLDAYEAEFAPSSLPVMLVWLQGATVVGEELVSATATVLTAGAPTITYLEGAPAALTITARIVDGDETLPVLVVVAAVLDADGDPLDAYEATFIVPAVLPVAIEWLRDGATRVGFEVVASSQVDVTTDVGRFRLELGDLDPLNYLFTDDQARYFIGKHPTNLLLAVADACDALAARFAPEFDFDTTHEKSFKRSQKAEHYLELGARLRARALLEGDGSGTAVITATDGQTARVLRATASAVTATFYADDTPTAAAGAVAVTVTREDGTAVRAGTAVATLATGQYVFALTPTDTADLDVLRLAWSATIAGATQAITSYVEVRGALLFSIAEARRLRPLDSATAFPVARIVEARTYAETTLEDECDLRFAPTYFRITVDGRDRTDLILPVSRPLTITAATVDGETIDLDDLNLYATGRVYREAGWTAGRSNIVLTGTCGYESPPPRVGQACLQLARSFLVGDTGSIDDVPECAAVVARYGMRDAYTIA